MSWYICIIKLIMYENYYETILYSNVHFLYNNIYYIILIMVIIINYYDNKYEFTLLMYVLTLQCNLYVIPFEISGWQLQNQTIGAGGGHSEESKPSTHN